MRRIRLVLGLLLFTGNFLEAIELLYDLEPQGENRTITIDLKFRSIGNSTPLTLPQKWRGQDQLHQHIRDLRALSDSTTVKDTDEPHRKIIRHRVDAYVHLRYQLISDTKEETLDDGSAIRPLIGNNFFHFIGHAALVYPGDGESSKYSIRMRWINLPSSYLLLNSFGANRPEQRFDATISDLLHAVYIGGNFRWKQLQIHEKPVFVAMRGTWLFSDEEFFATVDRIITAERNFWNDFDFPYFLVTLIPLSGECCSYGGTALTNSFATFIRTDSAVNWRIKRLLAHEIMHTWTGGKILIGDGTEESDVPYSWFHEGFTDYYTRELLLASGLISTDEYLDDYNSQLLKFYSSMNRAMTNEQVVAVFWKDPAIQKIPYQRGDILAHRWNAAIRSVTQEKNSLDDAMRDLLPAAGGKPITSAVVIQAIERYAGSGIAAEMEAYIQKGELIPLSPEALEPFAVLEMVAGFFYDPGFDFNASIEKRQVMGVREKSAAFAAGLRDGQTLTGWSVTDDPRKEIVLDVEENGSKKTIRYIPAGDPVKIPQYKKR